MTDKAQGQQQLAAQGAASCCSIDSPEDMKTVAQSFPASGTCTCTDETVNVTCTITYKDNSARRATGQVNDGKWKVEFRGVPETGSDYAELRARFTTTQGSSVCNQRIQIKIVRGG